MYCDNENMKFLSYCVVYMPVYIFTFSKAQQFKLAKYCEDILGDLLLKQPIGGIPVSTHGHVYISDVIRPKIVFFLRKFDSKAEMIIILKKIE